MIIKVPSFSLGTFFVAIVQGKWRNMLSSRASVSDERSLLLAVVEMTITLMFDEVYPLSR